MLDDADLDEAVAAAAFGAFMNQGQICMSTERLIVDETVADEFVAPARREGRDAGRRRSAQGQDAARRHGRLSRRPSGSSRWCSDAVAKGARLIAGGHANGVLMDATVLDHVTPAMRIYHEESFGPVAAIIRVDGADEAVRVANDTEYGLAAAVFGRDVTRALDVARRIESGICHINGPTVHDEAQMPFGGVKASGYGRFGGAAAIHEFTELRWITINPAQGDIRSERCNRRRLAPTNAEKREETMTEHITHHQNHSQPALTRPVAARTDGGRRRRALTLARRRARRLRRRRGRDA